MRVSSVLDDAEPPPDPGGGDFLTVLRCEPGRRATKLVRVAPAGVEILGYDAGCLFAVETVPVAGVEALADALGRVARDPHAFVIRGELLPGVDPRRCRRLLHRQPDGTGPTFGERPRRYVILDFDGGGGPRVTDWRDGALSGIHLRARLPAEFHGVSFWWSFSGSAGLKPGLRMKLAFWLDRPVTGAELGRWLASAPVDHAVLRPVQAVYVARPILRGVPSPVPGRDGFEQDFRDEVAVPGLPEPAPAPRAAAPPGLRAARVGGPDWPFGVLDDAARAVAGCPPSGRNRWGGGGRHHALYCAALRVSGPVGEGRLDPAGAVKVLAAAARAAGVEDAEAARTIRNGFRAGGLPA